LKVMNLVSLLIVAAIVEMSYGEGENDVVRILIALVATAVIAGAVYVSKQRSTVIGDDQPAPAGPSSGSPGSSGSTGPSTA
ncbi:hypothetical protein, partial [Nocardioides abyssi]